MASSDGHSPKRTAMTTIADRNTRSTLSMPKTGWTVRDAERERDDRPAPADRAGDRTAGPDPPACHGLSQIRPVSQASFLRRRHARRCRRRITRGRGRRTPVTSSNQTGPARTPDDDLSGVVLVREGQHVVRNWMRHTAGTVSDLAAEGLRQSPHVVERRSRAASDSWRLRRVSMLKAIHGAWSRSASSRLA